MRQPTSYRSATNKRRSSVTATALLLMVGLLASVASQAAKPYKAPRGLDGKHPDLNGIWQAMNEANWDVERHMAKPSLQVREGPLGPVPAIKTMYMGAVAAVPPGAGVIVDGGKIPYTPEALEKKQANAANWLERDPEVKCYLPGIPRANYMPQPFQILQGTSSVFFAYQYAGAVRDIYMNNKEPAPIDSWMGQSDGHWEGDTLVVEVTGQNDQTWLDRAGNHHTDALKVTERFTPMGPNHLSYEATIEDANVFTKPWKIAMPLYRRMEPDARLMEFRCVEFVEELMYGEWRRKPLER